MMKWRSWCYHGDTTLLLIEKHLGKGGWEGAEGEVEEGAGGGGISDTLLIRGSSSEVVVCTMKHADGDTMTHMLHVTGGDLDVG